MGIENYFFDLSKKDFNKKQYNGILCLDRDGVIIEDKNYLNDPNEIEFIEGSIEAIKEILKINYFVAIISNQAGLAKGFITKDEFKRVNDKFIQLLKDYQVFIQCIIYCPYHPEGVLPEFKLDSYYRKPSPAMFEYIMRYYNLSCNNIYMIGDKITDIEFGKKIGAQCIIVDTGYGLLEKNKVFSEYNDVLSFSNLKEAISWLIK